MRIFRLSVINDKAIWRISHFTEHSQSKEGIHVLIALFIDLLEIEAVRKLCFFC